MLFTNKNVINYLIGPSTIQIVMISACRQFAPTLFKIHFDEKDRESGLMKCVRETIRMEEVQDINFTELRMQVLTTPFRRVMSKSRKVELLEVN
jgi:hypothetical protein